MVKKVSKDVIKTTQGKVQLDADANKPTIRPVVNINIQIDIPPRVEDWKTYQAVFVAIRDYLLKEP